MIYQPGDFAIGLSANDRRARPLADRAPSVIPRGLLLPAGTRSTSEAALGLEGLLHKLILSQYETKQTPNWRGSVAFGSCALSGIRSGCKSTTHPLSAFALGAMRFSNRQSTGSLPSFRCQKCKCWRALIAPFRNRLSRGMLHSCPVLPRHRRSI